MIKKKRSLFKKKELLILIILIALHIRLFFDVIEYEPASKDAVFYTKYRFLFTNDTIYNMDYPYHFYTAQTQQNVREHWVYNPFFMVGYPTLNSLNREVLAIFMILFSSLGKINAFKMYYLFFYFLFPVIIYFSSRNFGLSKIKSLLTVFISLIYLHYDSYSNWRIFIGSSFIFGTYFSIFLISLFYKYTASGNRTTLLYFIVLLPLPFLLHSSSFIIFLIPFLTICSLKFYKFISIKNFIPLLLIFLIILISAYWIFSPFFYFKHYIVTGLKLFPFHTESFKDVALDFVMQKGCYTYNCVHTQIIKSSISVFGLGGLLIWFYKKNVKHIIFLTTFISLFLITYFHNLLGTKFAIFSQIEPYKFIIPLVLFMVFPASDFIHQIIVYLKRNKNKIINIFIGSIILVCLLGVTYEIVKVQEYRNNVIRLMADLPEDFIEVSKWIQEHTNKEARILFQDGDARNVFAYPSHSLGLLSLYTGREFVGGPYYKIFLKHHFASTEDNIFFDKEVRSLSKEQIKDYFNLYNIGWAVVWSEQAKDVFDNYPEYLEKVEIISKFNIYRFKGNYSFFIEGDGNIIADYNRIKVADVDADETIIKYHWLETLKTKPDLKIEPVHILDDPVPFIKIYNKNTTSFVIYNSYDFKN